MPNAPGKAWRYPTPKKVGFFFSPFQFLEIAQYPTFCDKSVL